MDKSEQPGAKSPDTQYPNETQGADKKPKKEQKKGKKPGWSFLSAIVVSIIVVAFTFGAPAALILIGVLLAGAIIVAVYRRSQSGS